MKVLLWHVPCEVKDSVPGHLCVVEDQTPHMREGFAAVGPQRNAGQRVEAQVEEIQVGDVGDDLTDLQTHQMLRCSGGDEMEIT